MRYATYCKFDPKMEGLVYKMAKMDWLDRKKELRRKGFAQCSNIEIRVSYSGTDFVDNLRSLIATANFMKAPRIVLKNKRHNRKVKL